MADFPEQVFVDARMPQVQLDRKALDVAVRSHGARFVHFRAMVCPVGMVDRGDARRPHPDHEGCSYGYLLTRAGVLQATFMGNSRGYRDGGAFLLDASQGTMTLPARYDDCQDQGEEVLAQPFDRLYLEDEDVVVARYETVVPQVGGVDRTAFPVVRVQDLVCDRGVRYVQHQHFEVRAGRIAWLPGQGPVSPGNGSLYAVRYMFRPFFVVDEMIHELRLSKDQATGKTVRLNQQVLVKREYGLVGTSQNDPQARPGADPARQPLPPPSGSAGAGR